MLRVCVCVQVCVSVCVCKCLFLGCVFDIIRGSCANEIITYVHYETKRNSLLRHNYTVRNARMVSHKYYDFLQCICIFFKAIYNILFDILYYD